MVISRILFSVSCSVLLGVRYPRHHASAYAVLLFLHPCAPLALLAKTVYGVVSTVGATITTQGRVELECLEVE